MAIKPWEQSISALTAPQAAEPLPNPTPCPHDAVSRRSDPPRLAQCGANGGVSPMPPAGHLTAKLGSVLCSAWLSWPTGSSQRQESYQKVQIYSKAGAQR